MPGTRSASTSGPSPAAPCSSTSRPARARDRGLRLRERRHRRAPAGAGRRRPPRARLGAAGSDDYIAHDPGHRPGAYSARAGRRPGDVIGVGIDFTACTMLPTTADGTPLSTLPGVRAREPHAWVKLWKHHAAQPEADRINAAGARARRAVAAALRRRDLVRVVLRQEPPDPRRGAARLRRRRPADRGGRLGRLAADRRRDAQQLHGRLQGDLVEVGRVPGRDVSSPRSTRASATSSTTRCRATSRRSARRPAT